MKPMQFKARDGIELSLLHFAVDAPRGVVVLMHGSTYNGKRYANLAKAIHRQGFEVLLPDWRGHGQSGGKRGDCDYIGQLEDDLADLLDFYRTFGSAPVILAGHSAGAVICMRYIVKYGCDGISAMALIAPAINSPLEAVRFDQPAAAAQYAIRHFRKPPPKPPVEEKTKVMAQKFAPQLLLQQFWLAKLLPPLRHRTALRFPANEQMAKLEGRVLDYSYNMMMACELSDYPLTFRKITVPLLLLTGLNDEILNSDFLSTCYHWHVDAELDCQLIELPNVNHMAVINAANGILPKWLNERFDATMEQGAVA